ncbi:PaaI family thioesterase [Pseudoalteromonas arctica]|uniref:PaaI family thioesterase n=1 Tax=Pseudoalteromonas arctica TaxID=394751 RepID=A0A7Y0DW09_9GAMM|nr:PaaI family thioesterase [Pseudoalteromonas arctica]NMM42641.1 PaaI family thioesterase [Pseudoalteromonas arctica]
MKNLTGLQLLQAMVDGEIPNKGLMANVNFSQVKIARGKFGFTFYPTVEHINLQGTVHGGFLATIIDTVTTSSLLTLLGPNTAVVTLDLRCDFYKPAAPGSTLSAIADVDSVGRTVGFAHAKILDSNNQVIAKGSVTCSLIAG